VVNLKNIILTNYDGESNIDYSTWGVIECYWRSLVEYAGEAEMGLKGYIFFLFFIIFGMLFRLMFVIL
jgi:hypothetical protein